MARFRYQVFFRLAVTVWALLLWMPGSELAAQTLEVKENQLVILKMPSGPPKVIKAKQVEVKELVIMTMDNEGKRSAWQKSLVVKMADLVDDTAEKLSEPQIQELISGYSKVIAEFPESKEILDPEIRKWQSVLEDGKKKTAELEAGRTQALQAATQQVFEEAKDYSAGELSDVIDPARLVAQQYPELAGKIDDYLKPWQQRLDYLKEGRRLFEGQWLTGQEIRRIQEERVSAEQEKHFKEKAKLGFSALVLPQTSVLITLLIAVGTLLSVLFSFFHLATARGGNLTFGGAITLLLGLAILGAYGFYTYKMLNFTTELSEYWADAYKTDVPEDQVPNPLPRMLFMASGSTIRNISPQDAKVVLEDRQMNILIRKYLKLERKTAVELLDMERVQVVVRFHSDRVEFIDEATCLGKKLLIRYYLHYKIEGENFSMFDQEVYVGDARLPASLASFMFRQFLGNLQLCLAETNIPKIYSIGRIEAGKLTLVWPVPLAAPPKPHAPLEAPSAEPQAPTPVQEPPVPSGGGAAP